MNLFRSMATFCSKCFFRVEPPAASKTKSKGVTFDLDSNTETDSPIPTPAATVINQKDNNSFTNDENDDSGVGSQNTSGIGMTSQDFGEDFDGEFQTSGAGLLIKYFQPLQFRY